jgi:hypothetical protein
VAHVRPPYATEELRNAPGSRSGSGTGHLFIWLDAARRALEADPKANLDEIEAPPFRGDDPPRSSTVALDMYGLFAQERWMSPHLSRPLVHGAPCEGVAQASFIAVSEETTLVMASPLYLRVRSLSDS